MNVKWLDIADPKIVCCEDEIPELEVKNATNKLFEATGKTLYVIHDKHKYTNTTIMYSTRNRLRNEFKKSYPTKSKVFFYFPIDDGIRPNVVIELFKLGQSTIPSACMFKFSIIGVSVGTAATRPICSYNDIHPGDWGGYCAYTILNEEDCPLYPKIAIPNVAFYIELYKAGYKEYQSKEICIDHLRHADSHHFKTKDTKMSKKVSDYLLQQREELYKKELMINDSNNS